MKPLFVRRPSKYDLQEIRQVAMKETSSIPRTENEKHTYRSVQEHKEFESWSTVASDINESKFNKLLWLYSSNRRRGISQIVMDQIERLSGHQPRLQWSALFLVRVVPALPEMEQSSSRSVSTSYSYINRSLFALTANWNVSDFVLSPYRCHFRNSESYSRVSLWH